jgi:hypothetical protein
LDALNEQSSSDFDFSIVMNQEEIAQMNEAEDKGVNIAA